MFDEGKVVEEEETLSFLLFLPCLTGIECDLDMLLFAVAVAVKGDKSFFAPVVAVVVGDES